jgi:peptide deformylase
MLDIKTYPYYTLKTKAATCKEEELPIIRIAKDEMIELCKNPDQPGVGLAAPQVGLPMRFFVFQIPEEDLGGENSEGLKEWMCAVNPIVVHASHEEGVTLEKEGCLSLPQFSVSVPRFDNMLVRFWDENKNPWELKLADDLARRFQHEYDHIDGITLIQKMTAKNKDRASFKRYMRQVKKIARAQEREDKEFSPYEYLRGVAEKEEVA